MYTYTMTCIVVLRSLMFSKKTKTLCLFLFLHNKPHAAPPTFLQQSAHAHYKKTAPPTTPANIEPLNADTFGKCPEKRGVLISGVNNNNIALGHNTVPRLQEMSWVSTLRGSTVPVFIDSSIQLLHSSCAEGFALYCSS